MSFQELTRNPERYKKWSPEEQYWHLYWKNECEKLMPKGLLYSVIHVHTIANQIRKYNWTYLVAVSFINCLHPMMMNIFIGYSKESYSAATLDAMQALIFSECAVRESFMDEYMNSKRSRR